MKEPSLPIWLRPGPAEQYYQQHLEHKTLRYAWVDMIRERWGSASYPDLALFPEIRREEKIIPKTIDSDVHITQFTPPQSSNDIFIYIHGGGWVIPASGKHLAWAKRMAHMTTMTVMSVDYRLSPEHPFPAALHDCVTAYTYARQQTTGRVLMGGDSAGGTLSAAVTLYCADHGIKLPDKVLCLSTYSDHYLEKYASMQEFGIGNPYVEMGVMAFIRAFYAPNINEWKNPYVSPLYGNLSIMPPTCVLVGMEDPLRDDQLAFAQKLKEAQVDVTLLTFEHMPHSFFTHPDVLPEQSACANEKMVKFMLD